MTYIVDVIEKGEHYDFIFVKKNISTSKRKQTNKKTTKEERENKKKKTEKRK